MDKRLSQTLDEVADDLEHQVRVAEEMARAQLAVDEVPDGDVTRVRAELAARLALGGTLRRICDDHADAIARLVGAEDRTTPGGAVRVWETRDAGATWKARGNGLPDRDAYLTVLREAFDSASAGADLELYFGATSGDVFGSGDAGASWVPVAEHLPPVHSVRTA